MASDWFNSVTGSNDYERQSYRDSYNGGKAAGDWTGGVNKQLDAERAAFQGATISGSSSQPSAIQWAQMGGGQVGTPSSGTMLGPEGLIPAPLAERSITAGPGAAGASGAVGPVATTGPAAVAVTAGVAASSGAGPGNFGALTAPIPRKQGTGIQLPMDTPSKLMPIYIGGHLVAIDRGTSNASDGEQRWGENEFLSPSWFHAWSVAGLDGWANLDEGNGGPLKTGKIQDDLYNAPGAVGGILETLGNGFLDARKYARDPYGPDKPVPGYSSGGF